MLQTVRVGVVGCGAISGAYFVGARIFPWLQFVACADLDRTAALRKATEFGVPRILSVDGLLADPEVDIVLNLTVPRAHASVALAALQAGKHTYSEKPLGVGREEGRRVLEEAGRGNLRVGCAPDTFLGSGVQTARKLIDDGAIGRPVAFTAFYMGRGHETWHPSPEFYYELGGGPMFDMGPYYLTALFNLLGPPRRITGAATIAIPQRPITSQPKFGKSIRVETPDHVCGAIEFQNGASGVVIQSFATHHPQYDENQPITIYGTDGTLRVPDPNTFDGPVHLRRGDDPEWREVPPAFHRGYGRSVGLADMALALRTGRPHRCSGELAYAVLDAMQGFLDSAASGRAFDPVARFDRPAPMPSHLPFGTLDD
jgi:predicted dehydrogenase